jgi:dienelactone hydrolase
MPALVLLALLLSSLLVVPASARQSTPGQGAPSYKTISYKSGALNIEAYLYLPVRPVPAPLVVYNHGSRAGNERTERAFGFVGRLLTDAGYAVLVPERRGSGQSDGQPFSEEIGTDKGKLRMNSARLMFRRRIEGIADCSRKLQHLCQPARTECRCAVGPTLQHPNCPVSACKE